MGASLAPVPPNEQFTARHLNRFVNDLAAEITTSCIATCASFPFYSMVLYLMCTACLRQEHNAFDSIVGRSLVPFAPKHSTMDVCIHDCLFASRTVLSVRMIAQFVGKEDTYPDVVRGLLTLVRETDAADFREALIPMLIREALSAACWVLARHVPVHSPSFKMPIQFVFLSPTVVDRVRVGTRIPHQNLVGSVLVHASMKRGGL